MAQQTFPQSPHLRRRFLGLGLSGALGIAWLAFACSENTERVLTRVPEANSLGTGGAAGGGSALTSGGVPANVGGSTAGGASTGGTSAIRTGPAMSALGVPIGFAAIGTGGTTGGGTLPAIVVQDCSQLKEALQLSDNPAVLIIEAGRTVDCTKPVVADCASAPDGTDGCTNTCVLACDSTTNDSTRKTYRPFTGDNCSVLKGSNSSYTASTPTQKTQKNEDTLYIKSNKTLLGMDKDSTIRGATLYLTSETSNVIIQNLNFVDVNPALIEAGDAITIDGANHVWIDHCSFSGISDGDIDSMSGTYVTSSWNHFIGVDTYACGGKHNSASTLSESSSVTVHHNYFDNTLSCSPKVTDTSVVHIFNNVWQSVAYYSIQVANQAQATIQNNYFFDSKKPYYGSDSCLTKSPSCAMSASGNLFDGISSTESQDTGGTVSPLPYDRTTYKLDDPQQTGFKESVTQYVGPTLTFPPL